MATRQSRSVAIFDLDHGVLVKSPATLLQNGSTGATVLDRLTDIAGPLLGPQMLRPMLDRVKDVPDTDMRAAGRDAASKVELQPHASALFEEHRAANRRLIATTRVPIAAAEPFVAALGLDGVIATTPDGPPVVGRGKLDAVRSWASENGASLRRSYFYGGSLADAPLLAEVGRPVVVDPDTRLAALAWLKGWPTRSLHAPAGVLTVAGREVQEVARVLSRPELVPNARFEFIDLDKIPPSGAAIVVGNHRSYFDAVALGLAITQTGRSARFLGKKEVFDAPVFGMFARWLGGIRVERGTGSDEPLEAAAEALRAGELIMLMPQGTIPRGPAFFDPELKGRWGAARLAAMTKAPVIPVGLWGTEKVWPRSARLPHLNPLNRPLVTVRVGDPVELDYGHPDVDTQKIMAAVVDLLPDEAKVAREPTDEELALTFPPGYKGDPRAEVHRRPGTDT